MKIKKLGHCCLLVKINDVRILTDPGTYTTSQNELTDIDCILITHEHQDHFHIESVKALLKNNPDAMIITNGAVGKLLNAEGIAYHKVADKESAKIKGILIEGYGSEHAEIYHTWGSVENTGYFINNILFYPGDSFYNPRRDIDVLALPVAGPWMKIKEAIDYALVIHPRVAFPVHDAIMKTPAMMHRIPQMILAEQKIEFVSMVEDDEKEF